MRLTALDLSVMMLLPMVCVGADVSPEDVVMKLEIERYGVCSGLEATKVEGAAGGVAMALAKPDSGARGAVKLAPGDYTLLVRVWAPAGDQDGFYVDVRDQRDRRVPPSQRSWHTLAYSLTVREQETVPIAVVGQELGLVVDQIAIVRGTYETDDVRTVDLPGGEAEDAQVSPDDLPRLVAPARLAELPASPFAASQDTLLHESFEEPPEGVSGAHHMVEGKFGKAVHLGVPDGRFVADASKMEFGGKGTIEFWLRPRPAQRLWWDQGWHYFIHCEPAEDSGPGALSLSLSRLPATQLQLSASVPGGDKTEAIRISTNSVDADAWHHLLVSWDMTGKRQRLWLLLDGVGQQVFFEPIFEPTAFARIEIGNTPLSSDLPFLFLDGAIDELQISKVSVADRLAE
jgi:hypothetical protein